VSAGAEPINERGPGRTGGIGIATSSSTYSSKRGAERWRREPDEDPEAVSRRGLADRVPLVSGVAAGLSTVRGSAAGAASVTGAGAQEPAMRSSHADAGTADAQITPATRRADANRRRFSMNPPVPYPSPYSHRIVTAP